MKTIAVIGGGAAGYFGAIACAEKNPGARVSLFESTSKPLKKVRISGGGRCNVTHHCFVPSDLVKNYPRGFRELLGNFHRFQPQDTVKWYESRGVKLKVEEDGRMFPVTDNSETIARCLETEAERVGVRVHLSTAVLSIEKKDEQFEVTLKSGELEEKRVFDRILIATGSSPAGHRIASHLGHSIVSPVPSLFTFNIVDPKLQELAGLVFERARVKLSFAEDKTKLEQVGPVLITHWGLSGPAVLKLSAFGARPLHEANYHAKLHINILPEENSESAFQALTQYKNENPRKQVSINRPYPEVPKRFWERLTSLQQLPETMIWAELPAKTLRKLADDLTQGAYEISGKGVFKEEFVTCGGVHLKEVDFRTMQSKICPGLFFAGEVLDIDGITGGFNFQNAWTSGFIAGESMI